LTNTRAGGLGVGSNSNISENGLEVGYRRAVLLEVDVATRGSRIYASGILNPTGLHISVYGEKRRGSHSFGHLNDTIT
jgi:glucose/arabinose dehydrogenase